MKSRILLVTILLLFACRGVDYYVIHLYGNKVHDNLELGIPSASDQIIDREGYALGYSQKYRQPLWVTYRLTREEACSGFLERSNSFKTDMCVLGGSATPNDYLHSEYDRGHLAPAADMRWSVDAMSDSFYMSNMSPQTPSLNRDVWKRAEIFARDCAVKEGSVFIVSGPIVTNDNPCTIGASCVTVPDLFYKVIYDETPPEKMVAFVMPNNKINGDIWLYATNVVAVEEMTGLCFFSAVDTNKTYQLKREFNKELWTE